MKETMNLMKRALALLLALTMIVGMVGCGKRSQTEAGVSDKTPLTDIADKGTDSTDPLPTDYDRDELELIVDLLGDGQSTADLSDKELDKLVEDLVADLDDRPDNIGSIDQGKNPAIDMTDKDDAYDEDGAMKAPFDQVYPELIEKEEVAFSGESILVKLASAKLTAGLKAAGIGALEEIVPLDGCAWYEAKLTAGSEPAEALAAVRELKEVLLAEYNYEVQVAALDSYKDFDAVTAEAFAKNAGYDDQWHFHHCGIVDGYEEMTTKGGDSSVVVAVIDSGVDYDHEDLKDNMWVNTKETPNNGVDDDGNGYIDDYYGADVVSGTGSGDDTNGHGTHVAGIIAARNNNTGVLGIAYNVKIMSVKAAMHNGTLNQADIARAVLYAYTNGAEVINMSFGGSACSIAVQDALATAYTRCVLVASAGNSGMPNEPTDYYPALPNYPAALNYVLGVMSVDEAGRESVFTNWDTLSYNGLEYELYAPGENIMSTLPDDQYGYLSGTSMAAPVVSAFAAILRSEFADRDMYPTKFIYGQLAATSGIQADCLDPEKHVVDGKLHSLPPVADLYAALTKLPNPEVNMQDYAIFDDPAFSEVNNGDGVIDAGETIALGLTLRNRWGKSENTVVTIDTVSSISGKADPYITIENDTVNYGSVGTYSTQDCGKIYTDGVFTGWENPFFLTVSEDCPNDYRFTVNVTITCENALDEEDTAVYSASGTVDEAVRNGVVLPSVIEEDMTLTPDNLYIIPKATVIQKGTTVRVEPGTRIQFWSDDPNDPYAEEGIAFLQVEGEFLVEGTKENPVYIYPSDLMSNFVVDIGAANNGYISLRYAHVTNLSKVHATGPISEAYGCTFTQNYGGYLQQRSMSSGVVNTVGRSSVSLGTIDRAEKCVFYKMGFNDESYGAKTYGVYLNGTMDTCIFAECGMRMEDCNVVVRNCVFLGNAFINRSEGYYNQSTLKMNMAWQWDESNYDVFYRPETGTTYVRAEPYTGYEGNSGAEYLRGYLAELFGGDYAVIETEEELDWLDKNMKFGAYAVRMDIRREGDRFLWSDGSEVGAFLMPEDDYYLSSNYEPIIVGNSNGAWLSTTNSTSHVLYEIPGYILPEEITFQNYTADLDLETTLQLNPIGTPVQPKLDEFLYESSDESILTVSDTGLVTPVSKGTADVWVWSIDRAVKNRVTVTVCDYVALEGIAFRAPTLELEVGTSTYAPCVLTPADTTRSNVTYLSSDPTVVQVDNGLLTAVGKGTATITATCEGLSATMEVNTWVRATKLTYGSYSIKVRMEDGVSDLPEVVVTPANADLDLEWTTDNEQICVVENGRLLLKKAGQTYLRATDRYSGLKVTYSINVEDPVAPMICDDIVVAQTGAEPVALPEATFAEGIEVTPVWTILDPAVAELKDGMIHFNGAGLTTLRLTDTRNNTTDEIFIYVTEEATLRVKELWNTQYNSHDYYLALTEDGKVYYWRYYEYGTTASEPTLVCENAKAVGMAKNGNSGYTVILNDNTAVPYNGEEKVVDATYMDIPVTYLVLPEEMEPVCVLGYYYTYDEYDGTTQTDGALHVLNADGKVYAIGNNDNGKLGVGSTEEIVTELTQVVLNEKVTQIASADGMVYYLTEKGNLYVSGGTTMKAAAPILVARNVTWLDKSGVGFVSNNYLYIFTASATEATVRKNYDLSGFNMLDADDAYLTDTNNVAHGVMEKDNALHSLYYYTSGPFISCISAIKDVTYSYDDTCSYILTEEGMLFAYEGQNHQLWNMSREDFSGKRALFQPFFLPAENLRVLETNLNSEDVLTEDTLALRFNKQLLQELVTISENGMVMTVNKQVDDEMLYVKPSVGWADGETYCITVSAADTRGIGMTAPTEDIVIEFTYEAPDAPDVEDSQEPDEQPGEQPEIVPDSPVIYESILDPEVERILTPVSIHEKIEAYRELTQMNPLFINNAILNPTYTDTDVSHWLRPVAAQHESYAEVALGGNWWGTTNEELIGLQMVDYTDMPIYARLMYAPFLTEAPENTFPFVTNITLLNKYGEAVTTVGNETITFRVEFNRDMDTSIPLLVRFGSAYPYGDYEVAGEYVNARTWEGTYTLNTLIENGYHYFTVSNGRSATDELDLQIDTFRFSFEIDTTAAQALIMQGTATETGIELRWTQDDFDTLMGYNVYRSTAEDGYYTRLNKTVIPADTMTWFDDTVEPGVVYYYNFTVVQTDLSESEPSGKIVIMSKDTMAPNIYHSPVANAFTGANLVLDATITDNLSIAYANLYYRVAGSESWNIVRMNKLNDKYSAIIPAAYVTLDGIEYYFEAFDGVSYTYKGSAENPFTVTVQEAVDANALGDVDGDGVITNLDALLLLYTINDKYNMTAEEFARADLNGDGVLWAAEALRILQYVSGVVGSVKM